jgi:putative FmdB family regulatory protein
LTVVPIYEYRCPKCAELTTLMLASTAYPATTTCSACGARARRIISGAAVRRSAASKVERLDPKYDRVVDRAMASNPAADPDRLLRRMRNPSDS